MITVIPYLIQKTLTSDGQAIQETRIVEINKNGTTTIKPSDGHDLMKQVAVTVQVEGGGEEVSLPEWDGSYTPSDDTEEIVGEDSPLPIEVSTEVEMNALLSTAEVGSIYKYTGTTGTYENGALYVVESVTLITFTINSTTYQATEGMTWGEWVESDFNADGYEVSVAGIQSTDGMYVATEVSVFVGSNDEIIANETYLLLSHVGGGAQ